MDQELIPLIQRIETITQMQFCGKGYLDAGHSIYAIYDLDDLSDILFHGTYSDINELPDDILKLNGCHLEDVAKHLLDRGDLSGEEYRQVKMGW